MSIWLDIFVALHSFRNYILPGLAAKDRGGERRGAREEESKGSDDASHFV